MVDMICEIDAKYKDYIYTTKYGGKVLYGSLTRGVYGTTIGAALWFEKLTNQLHEWGYRPNPYDGCTWNRMINGKQCTLQFHVDDIAISHVDSAVVENEVEIINEKFKTNTKALTITRGPIHDYLGMTLDWSNQDYTKITMYDFLQDILKEVDEKKDMKGTAATPASPNLFEVDEESPKLSQSEADYFH